VRYVPHPIFDNYGPGVDRDRAIQHLKLEPDRRYLLFFGFIRKYKGLDLLLRALAYEEQDRQSGNPGQLSTIPGYFP